MVSLIVQDNDLALVPKISTDSRRHLVWGFLEGFCIRIRRALRKCGRLFHARIGRLFQLEAVVVGDHDFGAIKLGPQVDRHQI